MVWGCIVVGSVMCLFDVDFLCVDLVVYWLVGRFVVVVGD